MYTHPLPSAARSNLIAPIKEEQLLQGLQDERNRGHEGDAPGSKQADRETRQMRPEGGAWMVMGDWGGGGGEGG